MSRFARMAAAVSLAAVSSPLMAQRGGADWMTAGFDAQRSHWLRLDAKISVESMSKPGFDLEWKYDTKSKNLTPPALLDFYIGYRGFRALAFVGTADKVIGIDTDLARQEWEIALAKAPAGTPACPGGMTSSVARPSNTGYPPALSGARGRGTPAASAVGDPWEGAALLKTMSAPRAPQGPPPGAARPSRRTAPMGNPFGRSPSFVAVVTADGRYHQFYVSNGEEPSSPIQFLPANANARGLIVFDGTAYVSTANKCGGVADGVWALDLESKKVSSWKASGPIAGSGGPAANPDGVLYVTAGSEVVALEPKTLARKAGLKAKSKFVTSALVFDRAEKDMIAAATADGKIHVFDAGLTKIVASSTALPGGVAAGELASWQDESGTRWILAAGKSGVTALKLVDKGGALSFETGWTSPALTMPPAPVISSGVVFALSSGSASQKAVLYAFNGVNGKELWNSGNKIESYAAPGSGLSAGGSKIYVATADGMQYAFGFPIEH